MDKTTHPISQLSSKEAELLTFAAKNDIKYLKCVYDEIFKLNPDPKTNGLNMSDYVFNKPLFSAIKAGRFENVDYLIGNGADPDQKSDFSRDSALLLCMCGNFKGVMLPSHYEIARYIVSKSKSIPQVIKDELVKKSNDELVDFILSSCLSPEEIKRIEFIKILRSKERIA